MFNFQNAIELCAASRIPNPNSPINMFIGGGGGTFTHCSDQLPSVCSPSMAWQFWVRNDTMYTLTYLLQYISTSACPYWQRLSFRSPSILTSTTNLTFWFNTKNAPSKYTVLSNYIKHIKSRFTSIKKPSSSPYYHFISAMFLSQVNRKEAISTIVPIWNVIQGQDADRWTL